MFFVFKVDHKYFHTLRRAVKVIFVFYLQVNGGSPAEKAGLQAGDSVIKVNTTDVFNLRHKEAQDVIVRAGQNFDITVQR